MRAVHLLPTKDQSLLGRGDALLLLDALLDAAYLVLGLNVNFNLSRKERSGGLQEGGGLDTSFPVSVYMG